MLSKLATQSFNILRLIARNPKWSKVAQKWPKMAHNYPKWFFSVSQCFSIFNLIRCSIAHCYRSLSINLHCSNKVIFGVKYGEWAKQMLVSCSPKKWWQSFIVFIGFVFSIVTTGKFRWLMHRVFTCEESCCSAKWETIIKMHKTLKEHKC